MSCFFADMATLVGVASKSKSQSGDNKWVPYKQHSASLVWKGNNKRPVFSAKVITVTGEAQNRLLEWDKKLHMKYPDGEHVLVANHLRTMLATVCAGGDVLYPTNKYAIDAVEGLLLTIQGLIDHNLKF